MWNQGTIWTNEGKVGYDYWVKHYGEPSEIFGIGGGRISKLEIRKHGEIQTLVNYDRDWDVEVPDHADVQAVYARLLKKYN
jgi:predicted secreted protein